MADPTAASSPQGDRRLDIDHLRNAVVLSLIVFHTARLFDREPWHIKDAANYLAADIVIALLNVPSMPLLFLLAGASAYYALRRRSLARYLGERLRRLLIPLVFGMVVLVPPQVYVERASPGMAGRASPIDFSGSYIDFLPAAFACCYPEANFSWHHLWFVAYLLFYALLLAPVFLWLSTESGRARLAALVALLSPGARIFWVAIPIIAVEALLRPRYPSTHDLIADWANHAHYVLLMLFGWALASNPALGASARRNRHPALLGTGFALALWFALPRGLPALAPRIAAEWFAIVALLGLAEVHLSRRLRFLTWFSRYAFPFYIVHQTIIVVLGWEFAKWSDAPVAKYATIAALSFVASLAIARAADLTAPTRFLFGMPEGRKAP